MNFVITAIHHSDIEIDSWKKIMFFQLGIKDFWNQGVLSATANINEYSPLSAILKNIESFDESITEKIKISNSTNKLILHSTNNNKKIILVPLNKPSELVECQAENYTFELIKILNDNKFKFLRFTHFGFMNEYYFRSTINKILLIFLNPEIKINIDYIFFDIDARHIDKFIDDYTDCSSKLFLKSKMPKIIYSKKYKYNIGGETPFIFFD